MSTQGTSNVWPNYAKGNTSAAKENGNKVLGQDDFLKILIAQLKHQDPTKPMEDRDFIAQMAQFSSVEQMTKMAGEVNLLRQSMGISSDLIGKNVSWYDMNDSGTGLITNSGLVEAISFNQGNQFVLIEGKMIAMDELIKVWAGDQEPVSDVPIEDEAVNGDDNP